MLSVGWRQQTTLLKNAACAITRDGPVIHQRNSAPIGQHANGFGGQCGAERSVWYRWNKNTDQNLARPTVERTLTLGWRLGKRRSDDEEQRSGEQRKLFISPDRLDSTSQHLEKRP
jgi:hypothetical protein